MAYVNKETDFSFKQSAEELKSNEFKTQKSSDAQEFWLVVPKKCKTEDKTLSLENYLKNLQIFLKLFYTNS